MLAKPPAVSTAARKDETVGWRGDGEREKEPLHRHLGGARYKAGMSRQEFLSGASTIFISF